MRTKPGAGFGFQPRDTLAITDSPSFHDQNKKNEKKNQHSRPTSPVKPSSHTNRPHSPSKSRDQLTQSFCDLIRSTTTAPPPSLSSLPSLSFSSQPSFTSTSSTTTTTTKMTRSRSASFSDDDLMIVSSQAMSSQGYGSQDYPSQELGGGLNSSPLRPIRPPNDVIDITSSPVAPALSPSKGSGSSMASRGPASQQPMFGRPTQMSTPTSSKPTMSAAAAAAAARVQQRQNALFNANQKRPEHHRPQRLTGPLAPKQPDRKAAPRPMFSSMDSSQTNGGTAYPVSSFYSNTAPKQTMIKQSIPSGMHDDVNFYTDPDKATADLKALLEGGMEDDDDDEEEAAPTVDLTSGIAKEVAAAPEKAAEKPKKKEDAEGYDDGTVEGVKVKLLPHQVEGVKWMRGRELGPVKRGRVPKGGILADDMGLGKTLQSISLILTNPKPTKDMPGWKKHYEKIDGGTLVVAPLALIRQWEAEIKEKVNRDPPLKVCVHHGPQRTAHPKDLAKFDVVITTYQILVSEHAKSGKLLESGCFGLQWYRVILDEAHSIKNRNAKMTKACCAIAAEFRWCLTGTPMQNNLDELQSLVNFLRITPYDNLAEWRAHIDAPLKNGRGYLAIRRLHSLLRCFMKRRTKDILKEEGALVPGGKKAIEAAAAAAAAEEQAIKDGTHTPSESGTSTPAKVPATPAFKITARNVVSIAAEFSPSEREFYDRLEERADKSLEKMVQGKSLNYANALVLLLRLRQACNHPSLLTFKLEKDKDAMTTDAMPASQKSAATDNDIDALADVFGGLGIQAKKCEVCMTDLTKEEQRDCEAAGDGMVCTKCIEDREILEGKPKKVKKEKKHKKDKKHRSKDKSKKHKSEKHRVKKEAAAVNDDDEDEDDCILPASRKAAKRKPRNRLAIVDSDDEEADGSWLVGEEEQGSLHLGKAGGEEDENAEGGGDWINSDDSIHKSEDEDDDASRLSSFIVDDEKEATSAMASKKGKKKTETLLQDWDSDESGDDEFVSAGSATNSDDDDSGSGSETESDSGSDESSDDDDGEGESHISTSELMSNVDDDSFIGRRQTTSRRNKAALDRMTDSDTVLISAKIRKMLSILKKEAGEHKFIVFSQFTSMLSLISPFLVRAGLGHVRYEGSMRNDAREASLNSLRHDPNVRVLLCSLKCGALGLNLTAATRVIILEPFWNPFVEEQAIDRVHRLTQTVDVTIYKLTVEDTVEQRILALQDKKRLLAAQALEAGTLGGAKGKGKKEALKLGLKELMDLFKHDARGPPGTENGVVGGSSGSARDDAVDAAFVDQFAAMGSGLLRRRDGGSGSGSRGGASQESAYSRRW